MILLKRHRLAKGLTGAEVAGRIQVSKAAYSAWETGRQRPRAGVIPKLARVLGMSPMELTRVLDPEPDQMRPGLSAA